MPRVLTGLAVWGGRSSGSPVGGCLAFLCLRRSRTLPFANAFRNEGLSFNRGLEIHCVTVTLMPYPGCGRFERVRGWH
jgi:hypothetical protein